MIATLLAYPQPRSQLKMVQRGPSLPTCTGNGVHTMPCGPDHTPITLADFLSTSATIAP
jgi:hypothetical protein